MVRHNLNLAVYILNAMMRTVAYQFSLLIWSPKPGVSMTVSFILTPFSSMSAHKETNTHTHGQPVPANYNA